MFPSPELPWEVIERVIDHSRDTRTLYSFTLTCRALRPRSTILLLACIELKNRNQIFDLCAVLQTKSHLQSCVQSVSIHAHEFSPHPLLRMLPNLSAIEFTGDDDILLDKQRALTFHPSVLKYCRRFGQHIKTLSLQYFLFSSLSAFSHILLSLPKIDSLSCKYLRIKNNRALPELITLRLSQRLHLRTLTIALTQTPRDKSDAAVVLLREAAKHKLVTLVYESSPVTEHHKKTENFLLASPSDWVQLTSFTWILTELWRGRHGNPEHAINILKNFHPPNLREVTVVFSVGSFRHCFADFLPHTPELCAEFDKTIMACPQPTLSLSHLERPINTRLYHSWMQMLRRFFPALAEHGALTINAEHSGFAGHDGEIRAPIITSANSRWAATGSEDGTIIVWDLESGYISQEWFAEITGVVSLAFSPDSRYILSIGRAETSGRGGWPTVWDLHQGRRRVRSLKPEGATPGSSWYSCPHNCVWSPDGTWIMTRSPEGDAVHIWETTTFKFQLLHAWKGSWPLAVSADGRWVAAAALGEGSGPEPTRRRGAVLIWNVELGELHRRLEGHAEEVYVAAFNPGSTRIATGSRDSTVRIWNARTGEQLLVLQGHAGKEIADVAFSKDGRIVLSHCSSYPSAVYDGGDRTVDDDGPDAVKVWDTFDGALLASLRETSVHDPAGTACSACFSPCGSHIAAASNDGATALWRTSDWSCIAKVSGGGAPVTRVAISPDGRVLCCGTKAGTVFFRRMHDLVSASQD